MEQFLQGVFLRIFKMLEYVRATIYISAQAVSIYMTIACIG